MTIENAQDNETPKTQALAAGPNTAGGEDSSEKAMPAIGAGEEIVSTPDADNNSDPETAVVQDEPNEAVAPEQTEDELSPEPSVSYGEGLRLAILLPCVNVAGSIGNTVASFLTEMPSATVYVYDHNSTDDTVAIAQNAGAVVRREKRQGMGFSVQSMLQDIDADFYVLLDGNDSYAPEEAHKLMSPLLSGDADMTFGRRMVEQASGTSKQYYVFGNGAISWAVNLIFGTGFNDALSGYRAFSRTVARGIPVSSPGYEVETEMTLQALFRRFVVQEVEISYRPLKQGFIKGLQKIPLAFQTLGKLVNVFRAYRPMMFFGFWGMILALCGLGLGFLPFYEIWQSGRVFSFGTLLASAACELGALVIWACGIILDGVNQRFAEVVQLNQRLYAAITGKTKTVQ